MNEQQYLYLTTTGHRTGNPHEIEIWFVAHDGKYYLVSGNMERSHWVQNIQHNSNIAFRVGSREAAAVEGVGRVVVNTEDSELAAAVSRLMDAKYGWSQGLIVELAPEA